MDHSELMKVIADLEELLTGPLLTPEQKEELSREILKIENLWLQERA
jgi:hypothetical protein